MAFRLPTYFLVLSAAMPIAAVQYVPAQVFVVGEKTATADISTDFHATRVELPSKPMDELGRRELVRDLEAEQGFAHRALPVGETVTLIANGNMSPQGEAYRELIYKKGQTAAAGDRVAISTVTVKGDRILLDVNGGRYVKHRFLRHIAVNDMPLAMDDGEQATGFRIALVFEGGVPEISAPEVKALLDPLIDFGAKASSEAYADALPDFLKEAIAHHDVLVGMNRRMVLAAAGSPETKIRETEPGAEGRPYEDWVYGKVPQTVRFVRIVNDRVVQVKIAEMGKPIAIRNEDEMQGYLQPLETHEIAMGDRPALGDDDSRPAGPPPTLRKPGEPVPAGGSQKVQFPDEQKDKVQPLPPAPGSIADQSGVAAPPTMGPGIGPGVPGTTPGNVPGDSGPRQGSGGSGGRVN
jgi:hypothetical protein